MFISFLNSFAVAMTSTLKMFWVALCVLLISCNLRSSCTAAATMTSITPASNETTISTAADDVSPLAKFVLLFSQPGAFARETQALFGGQSISTTASPCPSGEEGLICRRLEARRGAHECAGGRVQGDRSHVLKCGGPSLSLLGNNERCRELVPVVAAVTTEEKNSEKTPLGSRPLRLKGHSCPLVFAVA
ncbi:hypothetical protein B566_EDAN007976 [Ephemera danica]|nr:hypothetical protein B566_EDAN007976 [Ephemera danica]